MPPTPANSLPATIPDSLCGPAGRHRDAASTPSASASRSCRPSRAARWATAQYRLIVELPGVTDVNQAIASSARRRRSNLSSSKRAWRARSHESRRHAQPGGIHRHGAHRRLPHFGRSCSSATARRPRSQQPTVRRQFQRRRHQTLCRHHRQQRRPRARHLPRRRAYLGARHPERIDSGTAVISGNFTAAASQRARDQPQPRRAAGAYHARFDADHRRDARRAGRACGRHRGLCRLSRRSRSL